MSSVVHALRSTGFAGVERYVCDVSNELAERGWAVTVIGGAPDLMVRELQSGVRFHPAASTTDVARALVRLGRQDLVHAHMTAAEAAAVASRPLTGARVVSTRHFAARRGSSRIARALGHLVDRGLSQEIAISQFVATAVEGSPRVIHNGVRTPSRTSDSQRSTVLVMQRLEGEKETALAISAFAASGLADDGWELRIAGRGSQLPALRETAVREGVAASVRFLGFIEDPDAERSSAAIFLATAPAEPFGLSLVEAMAAGLPVVAAEGGAHPESLGSAGLLFPPGDAQSCAVALRRLAGDPDERQRLGQRARQRQRELFSVEAHVGLLEVVYSEVLS